MEVLFVVWGVFATIAIIVISFEWGDCGECPYPVFLTGVIAVSLIMGIVYFYLRDLPGKTTVDEFVSQRITESRNSSYDNIKFMTPMKIKRTEMKYPWLLSRDTVIYEISEVK